MATATLSDIERDVLAVAALSRVDLETLYQRLKGSTPAPALERIAEAVVSLTNDGLIGLSTESSESFPGGTTDLRYVWHGWFEATSLGREAQLTNRPAPPPGWPEGRIYFGMLKGMSPPISREDIDEARREMWGNFPGDFPS